MAILAGIAGLVVGLAAGLLIGAPDPAPADVAADIRARLSSAASNLDVFLVEYRESVDETGVVARAEYEGARDALAGSRSHYREAAPMIEAIAPETATEIAEGYERATAMVEGAAPPGEVEAVIVDLRRALVGES